MKVSIRKLTRRTKAGKTATRWQVDYTWPPHRGADHPQGECELRPGAESCTCGTKRVRRAYETKKLAEAAQQAIIVKHASGDFRGPAETQPRPEMQSFAELAERWYSDPDHDDWSPATADYYRKQLKAWRLALGEKWKPGAGKKDGSFTGASRHLAAVSEDDVRRVVAAAWNRGVSPVRGNRLLTTARTLYRYAIRKGWATSDPTVNLSKRTEPKRGIELNPEQESAWLAACADDLDRNLLTLYLRSAARLGDLLGDRYGKPPLDWTLVHLAGGCSCPSDRVTGPHLYLPHNRNRRTKERAARYIPLEPDGIGALQRHHEAARLLGKGTARGPVFIRDGKPVTAQATYRRLKAAAIRAGLPEAIRIHDIRHTAISRMARSGAAFKDTMAVVGHRELSTHERYMHPTAAGARAAVESLTGTPLAQGLAENRKKGA